MLTSGFEPQKMASMDMKGCLCLIAAYHRYNVQKIARDNGLAANLAEAAPGN